MGKRTIRFERPPGVLGYASIVGKKEGEGPLRDTFDVIGKDTSFGEKTWEKSESHMQREVLQLAADKAGIALGGIDLLFAGDLLNQCIGTSFGLRASERPLIGLYGACSTMAEGLALSAMSVDGGYAHTAAAVTSSHFCSAERQYRLPLEYGGQRTPTAQWTVTGAGALILGKSGHEPRVTHATIGKIVDAGIKDAANMGAAMAPAAFDTLSVFLSDTKTKLTDYDLIATGDLGAFGAELLRDLLRQNNMTPDERYVDCGELIYDREKQDVHSGGSGCGCSASVLCGYIMEGMRSEKWRRVLLCGTGALLSPISTAQGESIPAICHLVMFETTEG
jgi:stage V sporulation protein AD